VQLATPDMPSAPWNWSETSWLYQGSASGGRDAVAPVTAGAVASYFTVTDPDWALPARSLQVPLTEAAALSGPL
jgi:hypothetical protein